ncbi:MAG: UDP-N-acetylglucosamine 2-epimerase (non-hydrolyzing) [Ardenticatenia bacterium]|nr:MAG: UDP-N-acetylglucosamine 2-epimerase (non-hydrolyzing) [Ardenticatenia bacterium]
MRVLVVIGTRPEAIKMAPVVRALQRHREQVTVRVCATAQHRQMLDQVLQLFGIQPDIDLDIMQADQTPSRVAAAVLTGMEEVLAYERPDWLLVQGDTTTVMAAAIAAHHARVRVGHVEAGLRSGDKANPFPEEANRIIADHLSDLCFAPTERARRNLLRESIPEHAIVVTGNTVVDALLEVAAQPWQPGADSPLAQLPANGRLILVTAHRRESFGAPLRDICRALRQLAARGDVTIAYPVHLNPNVHDVVWQELGNVPGVVLLPPLDYRSLVYLMQRSYLILTDSGGIQEEAPSLGVPVLVLRHVTERPEALEAGVARLVGSETEAIVATASRLLDDAAAYARMRRAVNPYGDGHAAERIVAALLERSI